MEYIWFIVGLVIIIKASDIFLDKAIFISRSLGISEVVVGATIVSFCTVLPETVISISATLSGDTSMAFGNAIGSVICNTALILGVGIIMSKPVMHRTKELVRNCVYIIILCAITVFGFIKFREIPRFIGVILLTCAALSVIQNAKGRKSTSIMVYRRKKFLINIITLIISAVLIAFSSRLLVVNGEKIARSLGVPNMIIGLILTAIGSSLPELVTCLTAIKKDAPEISFGNILGANILNLGMITGICSLISPVNIDIASGVFYCFCAATFAAYLLLCLLRKNKTIYPADGIFMVASYLFFLYLSVAYS